MDYLLLSLLHAQREVLLSFYSRGFGGDVAEAHFVRVCSSVTVCYSHDV